MDTRETDIILDSISDGVFTVDGDWRITSFNRAAEQITGIVRADGRKIPVSISTALLKQEFFA